MLEARQISKSYAVAGGTLSVLDAIDLKLEGGDAVSIMGPSGSGKSTLLYILGALESPTSGSVNLDGANPFAMKEPEQAHFRNRKIGFLFQDHCLLPQCSAMENVLTPLLVDGKPADGDRQRAHRLLERVGMGSRLAHRPGELSGGEKQRTALARALIREPALLLCDEPTGNLDRHSADSVCELLREMQHEQNAMLVIVTHSAEIADRFERRLEMRERCLQPR